MALRFEPTTYKHEYPDITTSFATLNHFVSEGLCFEWGKLLCIYADTDSIYYLLTRSTFST